MKRILILLLMLCFLLTGCDENPYEGMADPIATITMEDGSTLRFTLQLQVAPNTVANFAKLANAIAKRRAK